MDPATAVADAQEDGGSGETSAGAAEDDKQEEGNADLRKAAFSGRSGSQQEISHRHDKHFLGFDVSICSSIWLWIIHSISFPAIRGVM